MNAVELRARTKEFAKRVIRLCRALPSTMEGRLVGNQLFKCGTSVGANHRATCRARSKAEFIAKLGIVLEEADESQYWLELLAETEIMNGDLLSPLMDEAKQLTAIFAASLNTAKE